jgi:mono/diheme cytochrome c family protein
MITIILQNVYCHLLPIVLLIPSLQKSKINIMNLIKKVNMPFSFRILCMFILLICIYNNSNAQGKVWTAPKDADNVKNPLAGNTDILKYAKVIYTTYCGPCHGTKGKGDGPAAAGLQKKPADHSSENVQQQTDGALYWMITAGHTPMPSYKATLPDNQRWELVNYIRTLASTKK